jgi:hypothetical protein
MNNVLYVAWRLNTPEGGQWGPIGRLEHTGTGYRFLYTRGARTLEGFQPFPEMPQLDAVYESDELFPLFANRLMARSRPEYEAYLAWGGFDLENPPDPIAFLAVTEGIRATDSVELFPCPTSVGGCYINKFFLHGIAHVPAAAHERISRLQPGDPLLLMFDDFNLFDHNAVAVRTTGDRDAMMIGYVPRYLAREDRQLCYECCPDFIEVRVERVNAGAPFQQRLLCRLNACWPEDFQPCADDDFQPIATDVPSLTA